MADKSIAELQASLRNKIAKKDIPVEEVGMASGIGRMAAQGVTLGFSDEIGAGAVAAWDSLFNDKDFSESFDTRLAQNRAELDSFRQANPKTAFASEVVGSVAPIVASILLTPFTGGGSTAAGAATVARLAGGTKKVLDSTSLLAGGVTKPGANILQKTLQGTKLGTVQGGVAGAGYTEGDVLDKAMGAAKGAALGATVGTLLPGVTSAGVKVGGKLKDKVKKEFNVEEVNKIKAVANKFAEDEISPAEVVKQIKDNVEADKLLGTTPVEILADYGGDAVVRKLRGVRTRVPGMNIDQKLIERTSGTTEQKAASIGGNLPNIQSTRIAGALESSSKETIKTPKISLESGVDDIEQTIQKKLDPLYTKAYNDNPVVVNLEMYKYLQQPIIRDAYSDAISLYRQKLIAKERTPVAIPPLNKLFEKEKGKIVGVKKLLPLEFLDMIKRAADQKTYQKVREGTIDKQMSGPRKTIANNFRNLLKESVEGEEYVTALNQASNRFELKEAFDLGVKFHKPSATGNAFEKTFNALKSNAEKDAFRVGIFQEISKNINKIGDNQDLVKKILGSPDLRQKIDILFSGNPSAKNQFINKLVRESNISRNTQTITGGSNTTEKLMDQAEVMNALENIAIVGQQPTSSAGVRAMGSLGAQGYDYLTNPLGKAARRTGETLMESNPAKQIEMLRLMEQLSNQQNRRNQAIDVLTRLGTRGSAVAINNN
tara:strand:+ start:971 stop:3115 length:2145 start_codon:yes stop_codon:yes gene_type:complete